jgi:hypothetical protein
MAGVCATAPPARQTAKKYSAIRLLTARTLCPYTPLMAMLFSGAQETARRRKRSRHSIRSARAEGAEETGVMKNQ